MKYAIFTHDGYGLPIAYHLQQEGHDVLVGLVENQNDVLSGLETTVKPEPDSHKQRRLSLYNGMVQKMDAWKLVEKLKKSRGQDEWFCFFDLNHLFRFSCDLHSERLHGNFPTEEDFLYEIDREKAKEFVDLNYPQVRVGTKHRFKKAAQAKKFLARSEDLWVLKGLEEDARAIVPDVDDVDLAHAQIVDALEQHPDEYESAGFILELLIPSAMELTPGKIYYDGEPVATYLCIENKPLGAGNIGPMTDCAQDLVFRTEHDDKINRIAFPPLVDEMAKEHKGFFTWDASLLLEGKTGRVYFGEFCANRVGYNSFYTELSLMGAVGDYFECLLKGKCPYPSDRVAASVRLFNLHRDGEGEPLPGGNIAFKERVGKELWLTDSAQEGSKLVSAGCKDTVGVMTGAGRSVVEAAKRAYGCIDEFSFEGAYYRPLFDFTSKDYKNSILNRLNFGLQKGLFKIGFGFE